MNFMEKIVARQEDLKLIHQRALEELPQQTFVTDYIDSSNQIHIIEKSVMRRGFKIQYTDKTGMYELFNIQTTDYYKYTTDSLIDMFLEKGFKRSVDELQIERDRRRVESLNKKIDTANSQRNDSLIIHWRKRREQLINNISKIEEKLA